MEILKRLILEHIKNEKEKWKRKEPPKCPEQIGTREYPISISIIPSLLRCEKMAITKIMEKYIDKEMNEKIANGCGIDADIFLAKSGQFPDIEERIEEVGKLFPAMNKEFVADLAKNIGEDGLIEKIDDISIHTEFEINGVFFSGTADYKMYGKTYDLKCSQFGGKELCYNYLGQLAGYSVGLEIEVGGIIRATDYKTLVRGDWTTKQKIYNIVDIIPGLMARWERKLIEYVADRISKIRDGGVIQKSISCYPCSYCDIGLSRCIQK